MRASLENEYTNRLHTMKKTSLSLVALIMTSIFAAGGSHYLNTEPTMIITKSSFDVSTTTDKLIEVIQGKGLNLFSKVDHAAGAQKADLDLRPTTLIIFGNPKVGTLLMQCDQKMGYELPMKMLVWENEAGETSVGYYDPLTQNDRYELDNCQQVLNNVKNALAGIVKEALN